MEMYALCLEEFHIKLSVVLCWNVYAKSIRATGWNICLSSSTEYILQKLLNYLQTIGGSL